MLPRGVFILRAMTLAARLQRPDWFTLPGKNGDHQLLDFSCTLRAYANLCRGVDKD